jgi:hypothetical protein
MSEELKACPYCNTPAWIITSTGKRIGCSNENCANKSIFTPAEWNTRASDAELEGLREQLSGCIWAVTKGGHTICQPPKSHAAELANLRAEIAELRKELEELRGSA